MKYTVKLKHRTLDRIEFIRHYPSCSVTTQIKDALVLEEIEALEALTRVQEYNPDYLITLEAVK